MDTFESLLSQSNTINEQLARQIFDILPEDGPIITIINREGGRWQSDPEKSSKLNISESFLKELCAKIDDGAEPVVTQIGDFGVVAAQLAAENTNCGYVIIALPRYSPESTLINIGLIEMVLNQIGLIANLIEKNSMACELQTKQLSTYSCSETASN